ncbi:MAG: glycoside hydrolase family 3 C-terminal domain-containing protein [Cyclobacteriaceae bacterium]|nr:glycoside hydrolase family 3 C-terminal domain-containing protein [Cyclobacteriaceae bacterium]
MMYNWNNRFILTVLVIFTMKVSLSAQQTYGDPQASRQVSDFRWPEGRKMAISLTFDDARPSQVDTGVPILNKYGVNATFYVSPEWMQERLEAWKAALEDGHEIGNHTLTHPCTGNFPWAKEKALESFTLRDIAQEMEEANQVIMDKLGIYPVSFAYPCGQKFVGRGSSLQSYIPLVNDIFISGRGWLDEGPNDPVYCDLAQLTGMESDNKSFDQVRTMIEQATANGSWLILAGHEIGEAAFQTTLAATLEEICRYASDPSNGIWIAPVGTIAAYVRDHPARQSLKMPEVYLDPSAPIDSRVEDLLSRMTLEEKIGQLNMPVVYSAELGENVDEKMEGVKSFTRGGFAEGVGPGGGFFTLPNNILHEGPGQQARFMNELQKIALENTRLKIPLLQVEEGTHGLMCSGATIFPEGHALGSSWNTDLINDVYTIAAREARSIGIHELFTLVIEPDRDPRLGRNIEGYSEDPYLCSRYAETIVNAVQGDDISASDKVVAGLCHYPGQSEPVSGLERGAMEISERILREIYLPPWEAGIRKAGALGVMATYPAIDGVPVHSSYEILTELLRYELGFEGLVLSEGNGVNTLIYTGMASDEKEAGAQAAMAGMDVSISFGQGYLTEMFENVKEGVVPESVIDRSVRRVLRTKFKLGLFENPFVNPEQAENIVHRPDHQQVALQAAREGIVLLKNENNLLPLKKNIGSVAVIGPNADDAKNQLGDYTSETVLQEVTTVLKGIEDKLGKTTRVQYVKGCNVVGDDLNEIKKAVAAAKKSDVAIVVLGENEWQSPGRKGTTGEGYDVATLELTGLQQELVQAVYATGTPVIVVLINGRPLATPWIAENIPAVLEAWCPGEKGGEAIADILVGDYNPNGKLPATIPRHAGQLPVYYNYKPSKSYWLEEGWGNSYADLNYKPLWEFGHGLSFTEYEYSDLTIFPEQTVRHGNIQVTMKVRNTGGIAGAEIVQLYIRDVKSTVVRPVKELKGFRKVWLNPGEEKSVSFMLTPDDLSMYDRNMNKVVEPGMFRVMVGSSSEKIHLEGEFLMTE